MSGEGGDFAPPGSEAEARDRAAAARIAELEAALAQSQNRSRDTVVVGAVRERLPRRRKSSTFAFRVADCEGYVTVGEYDDGRPGEVFMKVSKQGSTLAGIMDAFSISVSLGLQHGVPLATYVRKYTSMRFEPAGITDDPDLRIATSLVDYIFRRLAVDYLPLDEREELGVLSTAERMQPTLPGVEEAATPEQDLVEDAGVSSVPPSGLDRAPTALGDLGLGPGAGRAEQRTAVLPVRHGHAAGGIVLPVLELRDDERLFVETRMSQVSRNSVAGLPKRRNSSQCLAFRSSTLPKRLLGQR